MSDSCIKETLNRGENSSTTSSRAAMKVRSLEECLGIINESKILTEIVPKDMSDKVLSHLVPMPFSSQNPDIKHIQESISDPAWDLISRGGKRWRPILAIYLYDIFAASIPSDQQETRFNQILRCGIVTEILHTSSLILDDIEDNSEYRRGQKCLHQLYPADTALNCGIFLSFVSSNGYPKDLPATKRVQMYEAHTSEIVAMTLGQSWDLAWHNNSEATPTEAQYLDMVLNKTSALIRLLFKLCSIILDCSREITEGLLKFAEGLGISFQILDDILNLTMSDVSESKGYRGEDIHEGKFSMPVIHCLHQANEEDSQRLREILSLKTTDKVIINEAIAILEKYESISYSKRKANEILSEAKENLENLLPECPGRHAFFKFVFALMKKLEG